MTLVTHKMSISIIGSSLLLGFCIVSLDLLRAGISLVTSFALLIDNFFRIVDIVQFNTLFNKII